MATGTSVWPSNLIQKAWAIDVMVEAMKHMSLNKFIGTDENSIIQKRTELQKEKGDRINFSILMNMSGGGVTGNNELKGNEQKLQFYDMDAIIDMQRQAFVKPGRLEDLKSKKNLLSLGKTALTTWWKNIMDEYCVRAVCGDTSMTYSQTATAPSSGRLTWAGDAANEGAIGANDWLGVYEISRVRTLASLVSPRFRGVSINGKDHFVLLMHDYQMFALKMDPLYLSAVRDAMPRGEDKNPLFTGMLGIYDKVALYEDEFIPTPSSNVRRSVLLGAQALMMPFGGGPYSDEDHDDYGERHGVGISNIWGIKKTVFNSEDYATYVLSSYAPAPAQIAHA